MTLQDRARRSTELSLQAKRLGNGEFEYGAVLWEIARAIYRLDATISLAVDELLEARKKEEG